MIIYARIITNIPDAKLDFIEIETVNGKEYSLTWDESIYHYYENTGFLNAELRGISFGYDEENNEELYGNGRIDELKSLKIKNFQIHSELDDENGQFFIIKDLVILDNESIYSIENINVGIYINQLLNEKFTYINFNVSDAFENKCMFSNKILFAITSAGYDILKTVNESITLHRNSMSHYTKSRKIEQKYYLLNRNEDNSDGNY